MRGPRITRRSFLATTGGIAGATLLAPIAGRVGAAFGATPPNPATRTRRRLVVVFLLGGNDGLNTVVPRGDVAGAPRLSVYRKVRPTIALDPSITLPLDHPLDAPHSLGLHPRLQTVHRFYREGRVAVVQGVDYPKHSYSHFTSTDIWHSGEPGRSPSSGWMGRHLDRAGIGEGELRGVGLGSDLPLILRGSRHQGAAITSIAATRFGDGTSAEADARHNTLSRYADQPAEEAARVAVGRVQAQTVGLVDTLRAAAPPPATGTQIGDALVTARALMEHDLGVECVYVTHPGYDTHAGQTAMHERLLGDLDSALEAFWLGTVRGSPVGNLGPLHPDVAARTLVMVVSEFGRRIGENGGAGVAGTDHGAAAPVLLVGPPISSDHATVVAPGLHGDHPDLGTPQLPADNLAQTADLRRVYQAVLEHWLHDPDPYYEALDSLPGLFVPAAVAAAALTPTGGDNVAVPASRVRTSATTATQNDVGPATTSSSPAEPIVLQPRPPRSLPGEAVALPDTNAPDQLHPVSVAVAAAFNAAAAALVLRNGGIDRIRAAVRRNGDVAPGSVATPSDE